MSCVLRLSGNALDVEALLSILPIRAYRFWKKGDPRSVAGRMHSDSGANFTVSDADFDEVRKQVADATTFLQSNLAAIKLMSSYSGVENITLDFGVALTVGSSVAVCSHLPPELIQLAASANIGIEVSTYLCSEEGTGDKG